MIKAPAEDDAVSRRWIMAVVTCSSCKVRINVKDEMLGKRVKCPKCTTLIVLEAGPAAPSPWKQVATTPAPPPAPITRTPPLPKPKAPPPPPALDELDEVVDEPPLPRMAQRRSPVDDDDIEDAEYDDRPRRRSRRDDDDDDDDDEYDDDDRPRRGRSRDLRTSSRSHKWDSARIGLHIALAAVILGAIAILGINGVKMLAPSAIMGPNAFQQQQFDQFGRPIPIRPNMGGMQTLGAMTSLCGVLGLIGVICHFVAMCMSISAPPKIASSRARKAMIFFLVAFVVGLVTMCVLPLMGMSMTLAAANQNMNNQRAQANAMFNSLAAMMIIGGILALVIAGFAIASHVFWMLYHASVADTFRKPGLRAHAIMMLVAWLVAPFLLAGVTWSIHLIFLRPDGIPSLALILDGLVNILAYGGLGGWYVYLNRRLARLM